MNKITIFIVFVLLSAFVSADAIVNFQANEGIINLDGTFDITNTPVSSFGTVGYVCNDASCSSVGERIFQKSSTGNTVALVFPEFPKYDEGNTYGVFFYKPGYISWEQRPTFYGNGVAEDTRTIYLSKVEMCRSVIDDFQVINTEKPNEPVMIDILTSLDARVHSPLINAGPIEYIPLQLERNFQVEITVTLEILNNQGQVVHTKDTVALVDFDGNMQVQYEWTPTEVGKYTARVYTETTDDVCLNTERLSSEKDFSIIEQGPTDMCYTLLNSLVVEPQYPKVNDNIKVSLNKISNYYDSVGTLYPTDTELLFTVQKDGQTLKQETITSAKNANTGDSQKVEFSFVPTQQGIHVFSVTGKANTCSFEINNGETVSEEVFIEGGVVEPTNQKPIIKPLPNQQIEFGSGKNEDLFNIANKVSDPDGDTYTISIISQSNENVAFCQLDSQLNVDCTAKEVGISTVTVQADDGTDKATNTFTVEVIQPTPQNRAPVASFPDVTFDIGTNQLAFKLSDHSSDPDGDNVFYVLRLESNKDVADCKITNGNIYCDAFKEGTSEITMIVRDEIGLSTTDTFIVTVNKPIPQNRVPVADFPDVTFDIGTNLLAFKLSDHSSDPDGDKVFYLVQSESDRTVADCKVANGNVYCDAFKEGKSDVTIVVRDEQGLSIADTFTVTVNKPITQNRAPTANFEDRSIDIGPNQFIYNVADFTTDADGDELYYLLQGESNRNVVDCNIQNGGLYCDAKVPGFSDLTILVRDPSGATAVDTFKITVKEPVAQNNAPTAHFPDVTFDIGKHNFAFNLNEESNDVDGDTLVFKIISQSDERNAYCYISNTRVFCDALKEGFSDVTISVDDGTVTIQDTFRVTVNAFVDPNRAPIANYPDVSLEANTGLNTNIFNVLDSQFVSDPDGDALVVSFVSQSRNDIVNCSLKGTQFECIVIDEKAGTTYVTLEVSDGKLQTQSTFTVYVDPIGLNKKPQSNLKDISIAKGNSNTSDLSAQSFDPDGDSLQYTLVSQSNTQVAYCALSGATLSCDGKQIGSSVITIQISDGKSTIQDTLVVSVFQPNRQPSAFFPDVELNANSGLNEKIFFSGDFVSDPDGGKLTVTLTSQSNTEIVDCQLQNGFFDCVTQAQKSGTSYVTFSVSDGEFTITDTISVYVNPRGLNGEPTANLYDVRLAANSGLNYNVLNLSAVSSDPENDKLTYTVVSQTNTNSALCSLYVDEVINCVAGPVGVSEVTIRIQDDFNTITRTFTVTVFQENRKPSAFFPDVELSILDSFKDNVFKFSDYITDEDGDAVSYEIISQSNAQIANCYSDGAYLDCEINAIGTSDITVRVSDGKESVTDTFKVTVDLLNDGSLSANVPDQTIGQSQKNKQLVNVLDYVTSSGPVSVSIYDQSNAAIVNCSIDAQFNLVCSAGASLGSSEITLLISDGKNAVLDTIKVTVVQDYNPHETTHERLTINSFSWDDIVSVDEKDLIMYYTITNDGESRMENVRIQVFLPELGAKGSDGPFDLRQNEQESRPIWVPLDEKPAPGFYTVRISISNDKDNRIIHRDILFQ